MHMDPVIPSLVGAILVVSILGLGMRRLGQPVLVAYILAGLLLGPAVLGVFQDMALVARLGEFGVVLLLFFAGMEVCLPCLFSRWRVPILGTLFQILASIGAVGLIGLWFDWPLNRVILLGFVVSLSSTAVVLKLLDERGETDSLVGQNVISILLAQDVAVIVMLIVLQLLSGEAPALSTIGLQVLGMGCVVALLVFLIKVGGVRLPLAVLHKNSRELQVFLALILCFGFALGTGLLGLSTALGAFVAGILLASAQETRWVHDTLDPFRIVFVALFFLAVGMQVDIRFLVDHWVQIGLLVLVVFVTNTLINAGILRFLNSTWKESLYAGGCWPRSASSVLFSRLWAGPGASSASTATR